MPSDLVHAELIAVLTAVTDDEPRVMTIGEGRALPSGPFESGHRSLQQGLRAWVNEQTGTPPGYLEQLYTFADGDRVDGEDHTRRVSISYLGLMREGPSQTAGGARWHGWYRYFPWEDHRDRHPAILNVIRDRLAHWVRQGGAEHEEDRARRVTWTFGAAADWDEDLVLQRYELLYEAGLVAEAGGAGDIGFGEPMMGDHRRILATAIARLRTKIKYRPVVFELMPKHFTLLQLQRTVEALAGRNLYKPNFRRLIEHSALVEETGATESDTGGRPAKLFRFRQSVVEERAMGSGRLPLSRG